MFREVTIKTNEKKKQTHEASSEWEKTHSTVSSLCFHNDDVEYFIYIFIHSSERNTGVRKKSLKQDDSGTLAMQFTLLFPSTRRYEEPFVVRMIRSMNVTNERTRKINAK